MFGVPRTTISTLGDHPDADAESAAGAGARPGQYLTDGVGLFRLVEPFDCPDDGGVVGLEDCNSLEVRLVRAEEFPQLGLRAVPRR